MSLLAPARLRAVVVDDEAMSRARLCRLLGLEADVEVIAECADGDSAVAALRRLPADVVFLDIRLPDLNGFGVLQALPAARRPQVVFVTAHAEHALRAFDADAVDYLLKPYSAERLGAALARVRRARAGHTPRPSSAGAAGEGAREAYPQRLAVPIGARLRLLPVEEIESVIAQSNYVELHAGGQAYLLRETLNGIEARLDPSRFVRIHRSRIVQLQAVRDIEQLDGGRYLLRLVNGQRLGSGASYRERIREAMGLG
ncbi:response regulator [Lysobacter antibioticus]|uniref:LytR/AlgR family response regulator transcription factor n=1 Tax=Lysobacter antibioticus TaxID=84531 RepID=UPI0007170D77|nr:LytTR family DNA-binding domain-containing protein [Lysobacter antibioticus]ALN64028.1 response regulator [Lysobacter antibioticus]